MIHQQYRICQQEHIALALYSLVLFNTLAETLGVTVNTDKGPVRGFVDTDNGLGPGAMGTDKGSMRGAMGPGKGPMRGAMGPGEGPMRGAMGPGEGPMRGAMGPGEGPMRGAMGPGKGPMRGAMGPDKGSMSVFDETEVEVFLGIPFAKPPIGDLRWKKPQEMDKWKEEKITTELPNSCVQGLDTFFGDFAGSTMWNANTKISEDCLYLNIWKPSNSNTSDSDEKKAVLVWIHGGGFHSGTSTLDLYMGNHLARQNDVVVVSIQYRLGMLGFLSLDVEEVDDNVGLHDQLLALKWIQNNIENFGGDKDRVTIMGRGAGAVSIGFLLLCPYCGQYFHGAILQSGAPTASWGYLTRKESRMRAKAVARDTKYDNWNGGDAAILSYFQKWTMQQFSNNQWKGAVGMSQYPFVPVIDQDFIPDDPNKLLEAGNFSKKPLLLGRNSNEGSLLLVYWYPKVLASARIDHKTYWEIMNGMNYYYPRYPKSIDDTFAIEAMKSMYANLDQTDAAGNYIRPIEQSIADRHFVCPLNKLADLYTVYQQKVYYYWFDNRWSANPWPRWMGVLHGEEAWFTFGHPFNFSHRFTSYERKLSIKMMLYWTNFAKTGDPNRGSENPPSQTEWPVYGLEQRYKRLSVRAMHLGPSSETKPDTFRCPIWDSWVPSMMQMSGNKQCMSELRDLFMAN